MSVKLSPIFNGYQSFLSNGLPNSGGFIYTYAAGTTTPLATYTSSAGNVANANPIQLAADGRPPNEIWLTANLAYKFVLSDAMNAIISTFDNITGETDYSAPTGAGLIGTSATLTFPPSSVGAVLEQTVYNVKMYPFLAVGDGIADDTAAIQAAFTAANGKEVIFPDSYRFLVTGSIDCKGSSFRGQSMYGSVILCQLSNARAFTNTGRNIRNLTFDGTGYSTADACEIDGYLQNINNCYFTNLRDAICPTNIIVTSTVNQCLFFTCNSAVNDKLTAGTSAHTTLWWTNNNVQYGTNAFVLKTECAGFYFGNNVFEQLQYIFYGFGNQLFNDEWNGNWFECQSTDMTIFYNTFAGGVSTKISNTFHLNGNVITDINSMIPTQYSVTASTANAGGATIDLTGLRVCNFNLEGFIFNGDGIQTSAAEANFTVVKNFIVQTMSGNATQANLGGDAVFDLGVGSFGSRNGAVRPAVDNTNNLGDASYRWAVVYAGTGTINTSDENAKTEIAELNESEINTAHLIKSLIRKFKFKDAVEAKKDKARIHIGVVAQQVAAAFVANGLDPNNYGIFCHDVWTDPQTSVQNERYGIRYDELLAFVIASI